MRKRGPRVGSELHGRQSTTMQLSYVISRANILCLEVSSLACPVSPPCLGTAGPTAPISPPSVVSTLPEIRP